MSTIGARMLSVWREQTGEELTARQFFDQQLYPLFFEPEKMLQWVVNSPFTNRISTAELARNPGLSVPQVQLQRLHEAVAGIAAGAQADGSIVPGYPAAGNDGTTSAQASDTTPLPDEQQVYCAWLGAAAGIGMAGGLSMLLQEPSVLWALMEGWQQYRVLLEREPALKGNQLETWNGRWLAHALRPDFHPSRPLEGFELAAISQTKLGVTSLLTQPWVPLLLGLATRYPQQRQLVAYVYALGKTNRTIGFIPLLLGDIATLEQAAHRLFTLTGSGHEWATLSQAYESRLGLGSVCEKGAIGLQALEPARLREKLQTPVGAARTPEQARQHQIYQLWLTAMLEQNASPERAGQIEMADRLAGALLAFAAYEAPKQKGRGKTTNSQLIEGVLRPPSLPRFLDQLSDIIALLPAGTEYRPVLVQAVDMVLKMPPGGFSLFLSLLRFRYVSQQP